MEQLHLIILLVGIMIIIGIIYVKWLIPALENFDNPAADGAPATVVSEVISERDGSDSMSAAAKYRAESRALPVDKSYDEMTDSEKIQYLIEVYFTNDNEKISGTDRLKVAEDNYINALDRSQPAPGTVEAALCKDDFDDCGKWAVNGECDINPAFMLYSCKKSCSACKLSEQEKFNMVKILNKRPAPNCVYHGAPYPDRQLFLDQFTKVSGDSLLQ
jgi:hypothetical protein